MATKRCSYKRCRSIQTPDVGSSETFFQFPKDDRRYELWMTLSKCEDRNTKSIKYLCSKHFDHNKYMSSNPRRKLLLATAIPYPYQSDDEDNEEEADEETLHPEGTAQYEDYFAVREELVDTEDQTVLEEEKEMDLHYAESSYHAHIEIIDQNDFTKEYQPETSSIKRIKLDNNAVSQRKGKVQENDSADNPKVFQLRTITERCKASPKRTASLAKISSIEPKASNSAKLQFTEEDLITDPNVTTFIFKNEEYIQMPKKMYIDEKLELLKELQNIKQIVTNCKQLLDDVRL